MTRTTTTAIRMAERIEIWKIGRLRPYDRNPRTHSPEQVQRLAALMVEFGFTQPILVDDADGIVAGHGRLAAARHLSMSEVPVIVLTGLSESQKRAYVIADNKIAMDAGWDDRILQAELEALEADGYDLDMTGFSDTELSSLLGETGGTAGFIGGEGLQDGVARENNNMDVIRGGKDSPESPKAMAGFWFRDIQVSVPMGVYERFEALINSGKYDDRREGVVRILEAGMNNAEGLSR